MDNLIKAYYKDEYGKFYYDIRVSAEECRSVNFNYEGLLAISNLELTKFEMINANKLKPEERNKFIEYLHNLIVNRDNDFIIEGKISLLEDIAEVKANHKKIEADLLDYVLNSNKLDS